MDPGAWRERLPRGQTLPREVWARRHRAITAIALAHVPALVLFGLVTHHTLGASLLAAMPVGVLAAVGRLPQLTRRTRSCVAATALLTASAVLVHLWHGRTEAHFHFFVMVTLLATYEEWVPYLLAFAYVLVHHGLMGALDPHGVFDHAGAGGTRGRGPASTACSSSRWRRQHRVLAAERGRPRGQPRERGALPLARSRTRRSAWPSWPRRHVLRVNDAPVRAHRPHAGGAAGPPLDELTPPADARRLRAGRDEPARRSSAGFCAPTARAAGRCGSTRWCATPTARRPLGHRTASTSPSASDAELALDHQAHHDVADRAAEPRRCSSSASRALRCATARDVAVLFVDLDDFKVDQRLARPRGRRPRCS